MERRDTLRELESLGLSIRRPKTKRECCRGPVEWTVCLRCRLGPDANAMRLSYAKWRVDVRLCAQVCGPLPSNITRDCPPSLL